jgi:endonuclease/exonuclease/phosphatase family metal-dependent hydrolase
VLGDFNARPSSSAYRLMARRLQDAQTIGGRRPKPTFPSRWPVLRIDHIFVRGGVEVAGVHVLREGKARVASDHLPLCADLVLPSLVSRITPMTDPGPLPAREAKV